MTESKQRLLRQANWLWLLPAVYALTILHNRAFMSVAVLCICALGAVSVSTRLTASGVQALLRYGDLRSMFGDAMVDFLEASAVTEVRVFRCEGGTEVTSICLEFADGGSFVTQIPTCQLDAWVPDDITLNLATSQATVGPRFQRRHVATTYEVLRSTLHYVDTTAIAA